MAATAADRESLRAQRKLRLVTKAEAGAPIDDMPAGVYGFTYSPNTEGCPIYPNTTFQAFEIHKAAEGDIQFIGYMTAADAGTLSSSNEPVELKLYPEPFGEAQTFVSVPRQRIYRPRPASREQGNWMPFILAPK
ncbi:MAG: hypothetical protein HY820_26660 [Acidobacteria bacterium]|nr:hypothetical protein [Acidobacteriota bacterium]